MQFTETYCTVTVQFIVILLFYQHLVYLDIRYVQGYKICTGANITHFYLSYIFIIYICLKQNYIKQYKSLQTNTLFSGYRILKLTGFAKKGAIQDF